MTDAELAQAVRESLDAAGELLSELDHRGHHVSVAVEQDSGTFKLRPTMSKVVFL